MLKFNCLASFLLQLLLVASLTSAEDLEDRFQQTKDRNVYRPGNSLEELRSKEINITDIIQILEEHEKDLTNLRIMQGHTLDIIAGNLEIRNGNKMFRGKKVTYTFQNKIKLCCPGCCTEGLRFASSTPYFPHCTVPSI